MSKIKSKLDKAVRSVLSAKFRPLEFVLSVSAIAHGIWLTILGLECTVFSSGTLLILATQLELLFASYMVIAGSTSLIAMKLKISSLRRTSSMLLFIGWLFASVIAWLTVGFASMFWISYATISVISAILYINISSGVWVGVD